MRVLNGQLEQRKSCDQFRLGKNFRCFLNNRQKANEGHKVGFLVRLSIDFIEEPQKFWQKLKKEYNILFLI